jgi:hypothetical protein
MYGLANSMYIAQGAHHCVPGGGREAVWKARLAIVLELKF